MQLFACSPPQNPLLNRTYLGREGSIVQMQIFVIADLFSWILPYDSAPDNVIVGCFEALFYPQSYLISTCSCWEQSSGVWGHAVISMVIDTQLYFSIKSVPGGSTHKPNQHMDAVMGWMKPNS